MKSPASESEPLQNHSRGRILGQARWEEWLGCSKLKEPFLHTVIDSDAKLIMYLIQGIRFGSWKDRRLNQALPS